MRALLSVANRDGIAALARDLLALEVEMFATDGTREYLAGEGVEVASVTDLTAGEPTVGGQVKTFHHAVYAGILARRDVPTQLAELAAQGIGPIDLVIVNVKPFAPAVGVKLVGIDEAIEMIDVARRGAPGGRRTQLGGGGGRVRPVALRPHRRGSCASSASVSPETRAQLAAEAFSTVAAYSRGDRRLPQPDLGQHVPEPPGDGAREGRRPALRREPAPARARSTARRPTGAGRSPTRPSSRASGRRSTTCSTSMPRTASRATTRRRRSPSSSTPTRSGWPRTTSSSEAYRHALETDPVASFGGIVGVNRELDGATAREIAANSYEAVVAPGFSQSALGMLRGKPGLELLAVPADPTEGMRDYGIASLDFKRVAGGLLVETQDDLGLDRGRLQVVTKRRPTLEELTDLLFAWRAVRHVRSNAIVLARNGATVGIGAAQASRQVSVEIAVRRAGDRAKLSVMASDAYFPFPDGIQAAAGAGVTAIIQPGGSIRDEMAIEVADRHHMAMVFTGRRHFRH